VIDDTEPLARAELDDFLDPGTLAVTLEDGLLGADAGRIDLRWDKHPHDGDYVDVTGLEHYHPPPDASSDPTEVEDSCIVQSPEKLVTRAVLKLWRAAYHADSLVPLNAGRNPP